MKEAVRIAVEMLEEEGIEYELFNQDIGINAKDTDGVKQTFYPTTGTVVLHASNDTKDFRTKTFRDKNICTFIKGLKTKNLVGLYFENGK